MSHPTEGWDEGGSNGSWLPLIEYSVRSGISTSTIRRKIKSNTIPYRLENGRYLIFFDPVHAKGQTATMAVRDESLRYPVSAPPAHPKPAPPKVQPTPTSVPLKSVPSPTKPLRETKSTGEESLAVPVLEKAVQMVSDAFEHSLGEKEERIRLLEKQNADLQERLGELKTLVQILEEKYQVRY